MLSDWVPTWAESVARPHAAPLLPSGRSDEHSLVAQVSVHPLMQHIPLRVLKARQRQGKHGHVPFATVVTDFTTCHNTWFNKDVDKCFVATEFAKGLALGMGLRDEQVVVHGARLGLAACCCALLCGVLWSAA